MADMSTQMTLKDWRISKGWNQTECAKELENYAREKYPEKDKSCPQRTFSSWENGMLPRRFWLNVINEFSKGKVSFAALIQESGNA